MAPKCKTVNFKSGPAQPQYFSLPPYIISRLWENPLSAKCLAKLYQTCKYFYTKKQILISPITMLQQESMFGIVFMKSQATITCYHDESDQFKSLHPKLPKWQELKEQIWFGSELRLLSTSLFFPDNFGLSFSQKIYRSTIRTLILNFTSMTFDVFCILTNEKTVENLSVVNRCVIFYADDAVMESIANSTFCSTKSNYIPLDAIISRVPKLQKLHYNISAPAWESFDKLSTMKLENKLKYFKIWFNCNSPIELTSMCEFLQCNSSKECKIIFYGHSEILKAALNNVDQNLRTQLPPIEV